MAKKLTHEELNRLYQLNDDGYFQKEMSDVICREFDRETLDRSTIYRHLKARVSGMKMTALITGFCDRGYHSWVVEPLVSSTTISNTHGYGAAGHLVNTGTRRTCRDCGCVEETTMAVGENKRVVPPRPRIGRPTPYVGERP